VFANVSPLDPRLFSGCSTFVQELISQKSTGRYSPLEVAQWLDDLAAAATNHLAQATRGATEGSAELRRVAMDVQIQAGLGRFFAAKLRSGVLYAFHARTGSRVALERALQEYRRARAFWAQVAHGPGTVYVSDITIGPLAHQRGHWLDRLPAMDLDIQVMARELEASAPGADSEHNAVSSLLAVHSRVVSACRHVMLKSFSRNSPLDVSLFVPPQLRLLAAHLHYRHVDQAEDYQVVQLEPHAGEHRASIPASYTASSYPLQYFFELQFQEHGTQLYPGFDAERTHQPYFVVAADRVT
jgi:hypothetical protein